MKNVKTVLACVMALCLSTVTQAQEKAQAADSQRQESVDRLKSDVSRLSLTEEQKAPFLEITKKYAEKVKAVNANTDLSKIDRLKEVKTLRIAKDEEVKSLLTEEQFKTYQEIREERKEKRREKRK
jgi:hypothetical protein